MPISESRRRANEKYNAKAYDEIKVRVPKGQKEELQAHAAAHGESVNGFVGRAMKETIARDGTGKPAGAPERSAAILLSSASSNAAQAASAPAIAIPPEKLNQAKAHAEARREPVSCFLVRAIDETMERDRNAPETSQGDSEGD